VASKKVEYPKFLYHAAEPARIVGSDSEHDALGAGWVESPAELEAPKAKAPKGRSKTKTETEPQPQLEPQPEVEPKGDSDE
jgi:hypothetical protein